MGKRGGGTERENLQDSFQRHSQAQRVLALQVEGAHIRGVVLDVIEDGCELLADVLGHVIPSADHDIAAEAIEEGRGGIAHPAVQD